MFEYNPRLAFTPLPDEKEAPQIDVLEAEGEEHVIVLYNDEVNTFDHVIDCLMAICEHTVEQAQQCALITHHKGKCEVLSGEYDYLEPRCSALLHQGLSAEIH